MGTDVFAPRARLADDTAPDVVVVENPQCKVINLCLLAALGGQPGNCLLYEIKLLLY